MFCHSERMVAAYFMVVAMTAVIGHDTQAADQEAEPAKYTLRYKFRAGEDLRWQVTHQAKVKTTISGTTQTVETVSRSVKVWRVEDVSQNGSATFVNVVENVDMRQMRTGRQAVRYNSQTDDKPPLEFENVAQSIGVPLSTITINAQGEILKRQQRQAAASPQEKNGQITILLPKEPIAVGQSWSYPYEIQVPLPNGTVKKVKTVQKFTLAHVKSGTAEIELATQILTPIHDPAVEAKLAHRASTGTVQFDVDAGRVVKQRMDVDKVVVGFNTQASSLHYLSRFTEEFLPEKIKTAVRDQTAK